MEEKKDRKRVLVVGAGGFAGSFFVSVGLKLGYEVWAGVRATTSRKYLSDARIKFVELDFENPSSLAPALNAAIGPEARWDYIIYNLGATKALRYSDFSRINCDYLAYFLNALKESDKVPEKLLYMSSLSAFGPYGEKDYTPYTESLIPQPDTRYGSSKLKAEMILASSGVPSIVFRATGIYGPRDHDYFLMFKSIRDGFDFSVGYKKQMLSFIYVEDLAEAAYQALEKAPAGETYIIAEERSYTQKEFRKMVSAEIGKRVVIPVTVPLWMVRTVSAIAEKIGVIKGKPSTLNSDKYHILRQRNWRADISKARREFGFNPSTSLEEGVKKSVEWYKREGWL